MRDRVIAQVRDAGIVGAGGAGFPTHVKLDAQVDTIIVNGAECEPLVCVDQQLLALHSEELVQALKVVMSVVGADRGIIALKKKYYDACQACHPLAQLVEGVDVVTIGDFYPAGDEHVLVYELTGRIVPESGLPLHVGCVVINPETLWNISRALEGEMLTHKYVTVSGEVENPLTLRVPLGMAMDEVVGLAGGANIANYVIIEGGPVMGKLVTDVSVPVTKTTKALIVLPPDHPRVRLFQLSLNAIIKQARSVCCQCQLCTELCPRFLLGHDLNPHKVMRFATYFTSGDPSSLSQVYLCSECGVCDLYACPMSLSPRQVNVFFKQRLQEMKAENPHHEKPEEPDPWLWFRRIPTYRMAARLGVKPYDVAAPISELTAHPGQVILPLKQHVGAPVEPVVETGSQVKVGQLLGQIPAGKLGATLRASMAGVVTVKGDAIVIAARSGKDGEGS